MKQRMNKVLVTPLLTFALMLLTCEAATRLFARVPRDLSQRDALIGRRFEPGLNEYVYNSEADAPVYLKTNQLGFRGAEVPAQKLPGRCRVAVLGDSYTAAMALEEEQTFCKQLECRLNAQPGGSGQQWEILNFGIFGSGTGQELALYRHLVRKLKPDIVIVAFGNATDLRDNSPELTSNPIIQYQVDQSGQLQKVPQSSQRIQVSNLLNEYSTFYTWQKLKIRRLTKLLQKKADVLDRGRSLIYAPDEPAAFSAAWKLTGELFRAFRDECHHDGGRFMVTAIPAACQVYSDQLSELQANTPTDVTLDPLHPDRRLSDLCRHLGIPFLSLTPVFREHAPTGSCQLVSEQLFFQGKGHLNAKGSQIAASEMAEWLSLTHTQMAAVPTTNNPL